MAQLQLILQAVSDATHAKAIRDLLGSGGTKTLISVAFVREAGVEALEAALKPGAAHTKVFVGIRNKITTVQGIKRLLALKTAVYAVDTGAADPIFHPKLYLTCDDQQGYLIVGSANMTFQGLHNNIEASTLARLSWEDENDFAFLEDTFAAFDQMVKDHPQHVFLIKDNDHAEELFLQGRLEDEAIVPAPTSTTGVRKGSRDTLGRMKLRRFFRPRIKLPFRKSPKKASTAVAPQPIPAVRSTEYYLVWESNELKERDLNVPTGSGTHATGSMLWKKGAMENIDQRHYFRDEVFDALTWTPDPNKPHLERAEGRFEVVIKNLNYGKFTLRLTHNTSTTSAAYQQNNAMTQIHWGDLVRPIIARRDLLGRTMYLYRKDDPPEFLIEID